MKFFRNTILVVATRYSRQESRYYWFSQTMTELDWLNFSVVLFFFVFFLLKTFLFDFFSSYSVLSFGFLIKICKFQIRCTPVPAFETKTDEKISDMEVYQATKEGGQAVLESFIRNTAFTAFFFFDKWWVLIKFGIRNEAALTKVLLQSRFFNFFFCCCFFLHF